MEIKRALTLIRADVRAETILRLGDPEPAR